MTKVKIYLSTADLTSTADVEKEINELGEILNITVSSVIIPYQKVLNTYVVTYKDKEQA